jgi:hypothetical protein
MQSDRRNDAAQEMMMPGTEAPPRDKVRRGRAKSTASRLRRAGRLAFGLSACLTSIAVVAKTADQDWFTPGGKATLPAYVEFENELGRLALFNENGPVEISDHPFFRPVGPSGRACVTCHQPANAMSLSVPSVQKRWTATGGSDPLFAAVDGSNCPSLDQKDPASHSLLLGRGLIRIPRAWPPRLTDGTAVEPEFKIEVVRDPTTCNTDPTYGLNSANPTISVFRRPRMTANLAFMSDEGFTRFPFAAKDGTAAPRNPETGKVASGHILADGRMASVKQQAGAALREHMGADGAFSNTALNQIVDFVEQLYAAQVFSTQGGSLVGPDGPPAFGPRNLATSPKRFLGNDTETPTFPMGDAWRNRDGKTPAAQQEYRLSVKRGQDVFFTRTFFQGEVMGFNSLGLGSPVKRTCTSCHNMLMAGNGWDPGFLDGAMDIGTTNMPWATEPPHSPWSTRKPDLPLFKITCRKDVIPHLYLGRVIYTTDPGRALTTGLCRDVGTITQTQMRGLAARAPYFTNGSAATIRELIDFYDRRFQIQYTEREKLDLQHFLESL